MSGGSLPHADMLYVKREMPQYASLARDYNAARATFINARLLGEPSDELRSRAEALRDRLIEAQRVASAS